MNKLAEKIMDIGASDRVYLYWLGGAGFVFRYKDILVGIDLYLSDACNDPVTEEFKRLVPAPLEAEDIKLDYLISTHEHGDHLDVGSIHKFINRKTATKLIGTGTVINECEKMGVDKDKMIKLDRNESISFGNLKVEAVFCDHGDQSIDAIGAIITIGGCKIYFTGDNAYKPNLYKFIHPDNDIDILLVPINGTFDNPDPKDASYITAWVRPKTVIPCHYWLFKEHGGNPAEFVKQCSKIAPESKIKVLAIGEEFVI